MTEAFPLHWPEGWKRSTHRQSHPSFKATFTTARDGLRHELRLMGARMIVISTNLPTKSDGLPYAGQKNPKDPGVAVYFRRGDKSMVLACDRWWTVTENLRALEKTVEAMRGLDRWGASQVLERVFTGFQQLPPAEPVKQEPWWAVLEVSAFATVEQCRVQRRELAKIYHPDSGTQPDAARMARINAAVDWRERNEP